MTSRSEVINIKLFPSFSNWFAALQAPFNDKMAEKERKQILTLLSYMGRSNRNSIKYPGWKVNFRRAKLAHDRSRQLSWTVKLFPILRFFSIGIFD